MVFYQNEDQTLVKLLPPSGRLQNKANLRSSREENRLWVFPFQKKWISNIFLQKKVDIEYLLIERSPYRFSPSKSRSKIVDIYFFSYGKKSVSYFPIEKVDIAFFPIEKSIEMSRYQFLSLLKKIDINFFPNQRSRYNFFPTEKSLYQVDVRFFSSTVFLSK